MILLTNTPVDPRRRLPDGASAPQSLSTQVVVESLERPVCDLRGAPLPAGCALELGYFSRAQMATPFRGKWIPLSGLFTVDRNRGIQYPRIGDGGAGPGCFVWHHTFAHGVETLAPVNVPLAIRFFDHADPQAARAYNTATNASWWCRPPKAGRPALVFMSLDFEGVLWEGGARDEFRTTLPVFGSMFSRLMALGDTSADVEL